MAPNTVRGNHSSLSLASGNLLALMTSHSLLLSLWHVLFSLSVTCHFLSVYLSVLFVLCCGSYFFLGGGGKEGWCVCMCVYTCTHTGLWLKNMARAVYIGTNEQQYPSSWWELRRCRVVSIQPCAEKEGGCTAEERGLRGKGMQRLAEGGGRSVLQVRHLRQVEAMLLFYFLICLRDEAPY